MTGIQSEVFGAYHILWNLVYLLKLLLTAFHVHRENGWGGFTKQCRVSRLFLIIARLSIAIKTFRKHHNLFRRIFRTAQLFHRRMRNGQELFVFLARRNALPEYSLLPNSNLHICFFLRYSSGVFVIFLLRFSMVSCREANLLDIHQSWCRMWFGIGFFLVDSDKFCQLIFLLYQVQLRLTTSSDFFRRRLFICKVLLPKNEIALTARAPWMWGVILSALEKLRLGRDDAGISRGCAVYHHDSTWIFHRNVGFNFCRTCRGFSSEKVYTSPYDQARVLRLVCFSCSL